MLTRTSWSTAARFPFRCSNGTDPRATFRPIGSSRRSCVSTRKRGRTGDACNPQLIWHGRDQRCRRSSRGRGPEIEGALWLKTLPLA
jgi:hypothetical protein